MYSFYYIYPKLNNIYTLRYYNSLYFCKFIKSTEKGYNFINLKNYKLIFKKHLYQKNNGFVISSKIKINMYDGLYCIDKKYEKTIRGIKLKN